MVIMLKILDKKLERQSNFELLRIVAMLFIVIRHFSFYSGFDDMESELLINNIWITAVHPLGKLGVDMFVLVSGYFLAGKSRVTIKKTAKLWGQILFYTVLIFIVSVLIDPANYSSMKMLESFFPIFYDGLWFTKTYFMFLVLTPFLNMVLNSLSKRAHGTALLLFLICWTLVPSEIQEEFQYSDLLWFCFLFFVAAFIKKWENNTKLSPAKCFLMFGIVYLFLGGYKIISLYNHGIMKFYKPYTMNSIFNLLCSLFLFLGFKNIEIKNPKINTSVNLIAYATFGVYLIHDNNYIRDVLWEKVFKGPEMLNSGFLIVYGTLAAIAVFCVCIAIDLVRIYLIERQFIKVVDKCEPAFRSFLIKIYEAVIKAAKMCRLFLLSEK